MNNNKIHVIWNSWTNGVEKCIFFISLHVFCYESSQYHTSKIIIIDFNSYEVQELSYSFHWQLNHDMSFSNIFFFFFKKPKNFLTVLKRHSLHVKIAIKSQIQTHLCHNRWFAILSILCYKRKSKVYFNIGAVTRTLSKSNQSCYFSSLLTKRKKSVVQLHDFSRKKNSPIFKISWEPCGFCANAIFSWNSYEAHLN